MLLFLGFLIFRAAGIVVSFISLNIPKTRMNKNMQIFRWIFPKNSLMCVLEMANCSEMHSIFTKFCVHPRSYLSYCLTLLRLNLDLKLIFEFLREICFNELKFSNL